MRRLLIGVVLVALLIVSVLNTRSQAADDDRFEAQQRIYETYRAAKRERSRRDGRFTTVGFTQPDLVRTLNATGPHNVTAGRDRNGDGVVDDPGEDAGMVLIADGGHLSLAEHAGGRTVRLRAGPRGFSF